MRQLIKKLGRLNSVIIITLFSVLASVFITFIVLYFTIFDASISLAIITPLILTPLISWPAISLLIKLDNLENEMRALATYDSLTGLLTRRAFLHDAENLINYAEREKVQFSIIALDLDKFKNINDSYGHSAGDQVLEDFSAITKTIVRKGDLVGRIGGEEFALFLPNTSNDAAYSLAERLHEAVRGSSINYEHSLIKYTVSMGLVSLLPNKTDSIENLLKKADKSLYLAKEKGRNCTVIFNANS